MKTLLIPFNFQSHCLEKHNFIKTSSRVLQKASQLKIKPTNLDCGDQACELAKTFGCFTRFSGCRSNKK